MKQKIEIGTPCRCYVVHEDVFGRVNHVYLGIKYYIGKGKCICDFDPSAILIGYDIIVPICYRDDNGWREGYSHFGMTDFLRENIEDTPVDATCEGVKAYFDKRVNYCKERIRLSSSDRHKRIFEELLCEINDLRVNAFKSL